MNSMNELRMLIEKHALQGITPLPLMPNIILNIETEPTVPCQLVIEPVFSLIAQGAKCIDVGHQVFDYHAGQFLIFPVDLPADAYVVEATPQSPYLGFGLLLRPEAISSLLLESPRMPSLQKELTGISLSDLSNELIDCAVRLLRLLDTPSDIPILAATYEREILWRLLTGPQGPMIRQVGLADSHISQVGRAIRQLRKHFTETIRIEALAAVAGMSITSFHRHFRIITAMTPIQYQKKLRLQTARRRLMSANENVSEVAFAVGYDNPSQFSREYRRMYGKPPGQDGQELRVIPKE